MLVASLGGQRVEADVAEKGPEYRCPNCDDVLILKKGRIVTHHFAHKPPVTCNWGIGETIAHQAAKRLFKEEFLSRGLHAEVESVVSSLPSDRRADVMIWSPTGERFALELQHIPIGYEELETRTRSYIRANVRVIWIPFLRREVWREAEEIWIGDGDYKVEKFSARPLERWVHGYNFGELWFYDSFSISLWKAKLTPHNMHVKETSWYDEFGEEQYAGGYLKQSRRWRELTLWGPYSLSVIRISKRRRREGELGKHRYPGGIVGKIVSSDSQS